MGARKNNIKRCDILFHRVTLHSLMLASGFKRATIYLRPAKQKRHCKRVRICIKFPYQGDILIGSMPAFKEEIEY